MRRLLVLGGTAEANDLARRLAGQAGLHVVLSLAGRTRAPVLPAGVEARVGGFGAAAGLGHHLAEHGIAGVIDATHPFAARIAANARLACDETGVPRLKLLRPMWPREPGDDWRTVADGAAAADQTARLGRRALVTLGHGELDPFRTLRGVRCLVRTIEPPAEPWPEHMIPLAARGPFAEADETALMRGRGIDVLVTKASGGTATAGKIAAARGLGLPVVMIKRPEPPPGPVVPDAAAAAHWALRLAEAHDAPARAGRSTWL